MSLKEVVEEYLAEVFGAHRMGFIGSQFGGLDSKSGQVHERVEFGSAHIRLRIERRDGEINAQIRRTEWVHWRYVREISEHSLRNESLKELLTRVPDRPRTDDEMLAGLLSPITIALHAVGKWKA